MRQFAFAFALALCACSEKKSGSEKKSDQPPVIIVTRNEITYQGKVISPDAAEVVAPRLELGKQIGGTGMGQLGLSIERVLLIDKRATSDAIVELDLNTGTGTDLFTTNDRLDWGTCDRKVQHCVLQRSTPSAGRDSHRRADLVGVLLIDGREVRPLALKTVPNPELASNPISPDGKIVVIEDITPKGTRLVAVDFTSKRLATLANMNAAGWVQTDGKWAARVHTLDKVDVLTYQIWDVERGEVTPAATPEVLGRSPQGTRTATLADGKLTVTYEGKARVLELDADDARYCAGGCGWVDDRLIEMRGRLVDTQTMTLTRTGHDVVWYVPGTRSALVATERGLFLASVILP